MLHQKKKKLYFSLVLIYTVSNQLPQKVFFNENSGCIFRLEQNATCNPQLSRFRNTAIQSLGIVVFCLWTFLNSTTFSWLQLKIV